MRILFTLPALIASTCLVVLQAQVPQLTNFQSRGAIEGVNFTGDGLFKFNLVSGDAATIWTGDGMLVFGGAPPVLAYDPAIYDYVRSKPMYLYQRP